MKRTKLPYALTIALGQYFLNYQLSQEQCINELHRSDGTIEKTYRSGRPWDSQKDLQRVWDACPAGWGGEKCAGSFWFTVPLLKKHHYYIDSSLWPLAEVRPNLR